MKNKILIRFVESLVLLPITTMSAVPVGPITQATLNIVMAPQTVLFQKENINGYGIFAQNEAKDSMPEDKMQVFELQAEAIDAYFREYDMPLEGLGLHMAIEAHKNSLDWRLLPAISVIESTGGKHACKRAENSFFGWGSCKIDFESNEKAVEIVAWNLGGNNLNTARYYRGKNTKEILLRYNPPSVVPNYTHKVMKVMNAIGDENMILADTDNPDNT